MTTTARDQIVAVLHANDYSEIAKHEEKDGPYRLRTFAKYSGPKGDVLMLETQYHTKDKRYEYVEVWAPVVMSIKTDDVCNAVRKRAESL